MRTLRESLYDYCQRTENQKLLSQWDAQRNGTLSPDTISYGSKAKAWWHCEKGHHWQAVIKSRASGAGCPFCTNRKVMTGENDLLTRHPDLAAQWHPERNGTLLPSQVLSGSHKKVWWRCEKGHSWQAAIVSRTSDGTGCPVCAGKLIIPGENDLASRFPDVAAQWHPSKNGTLTAQAVSPFSNRRVWWICKRGHSWQAAVSARTLWESGCPYCTGKKVLPGFNDLATRQPEIAAQWYQPLNGELTPEMVTLGCNKKVWWQCEKGHVWQAVIYSRCGAQKAGCPVCAGTVKERRRAAVRSHA